MLETQLAIDQQRGLLARQLAETMRTELLASRRQWENRLLGQAASRWGFSPFALVLRIYQGLGALVAGALLFRVRTPAQVALCGRCQGVRTWKGRREKHQADRGLDRAAAAGWDPAELRKAVIIVDGYAADAGLDRRPVQAEVIAAESEAAAAGFVARVSADLDLLIARLAKLHTGWFTRFRYEILLLAMLGLLLYRLGKNFFYDSWLAEPRRRSTGSTSTSRPVFGWCCGACCCCGRFAAGCAAGCARRHRTGRRLATERIGRRIVRPIRRIAAMPNGIARTSTPCGGKWTNCNGKWRRGAAKCRVGQANRNAGGASVAATRPLPPRA